MTISAKVIAYSVSEHSKSLITLQLRYPKFIHGEFMTHRVFSRNASSSRAIPVERLIKDVIDDPVYPSFWGKNQPGMQAKEECNERIRTWGDPPEPEGFSWNREEAWDAARRNAITMAQAFAKAGYHKQIVNRLIEPFCHINVVVTATEWDNFFLLRCHSDAQPEMKKLADCMLHAILDSRPVKLEPGQWHLPYITEQDQALGLSSDPINLSIRVSVARCARVSYLTQEGKPPNIEDDLKLYDRLVGSTPIHASPTEHQATPDEYWRNEDTGIVSQVWQRPDLHGNLKGWIQYRKQLEQIL